MPHSQGQLPPPPDEFSPADVSVEVVPDGDMPDVDASGNILRIDHGDGSVTLSLNGQPLQEAEQDDSPQGWYANLALKIDPAALRQVGEDLIRGVDEDLQSRQEFIEDRALGVKLLGLKIELPNLMGAADGAPVEGMSKVRHPLLLEAVLRFQANARSELLPTDGPVKVRNDSTSPTLLSDQLADALELDFNHYLTAVAKEYYPDTDRMLFMTGFGGDGFKKVYPCPLRNRPVAESVDADDLIVNQAATDLTTALRITHRVRLRPSVVKRMQLLGAYREVELGDAQAPMQDPLQEEKTAQQGVTVDISLRPEDRERLIYEICCELDLPGYEHKKNGKVTGLPIPYVVTIDVSSREVLAITRNYKPETKDLPVARRRFVKYPFVPGLGFYSIGLLHILGNSTNAVTAAWREMLDNGMYANFPGFLMADTGGRQNTNIFRVPPGGGAQIKTGGAPIREAVMPLPYETAGMPAMMQLVENMVETGRRIGGTAEVQVGEGRADVPVGTMLAMIDQAIKVMNAVHKRMHAAQAEEFQLLKELFQEDPESFFRHGCASHTQWDREMFIRALNNCNLVPQADPNTASAGHRIMKVVGLMQLSDKAPQLYDPIKVHTLALRTMGFNNPDEVFVPPQARANPPPQLIQAQAEMANKKQATDAKTQEAQARLVEANARDKEAEAKIEERKAAGQDDPVDTATAQAKLIDAHTRQREVGLKEQTAQVEDQNRDQDREAQQQDAAISLAKEIMKDPAAAPNAAHLATTMIDQINRGLPQ